MKKKFELRTTAEQLEKDMDNILECDIVRAGSQSRKLREPHTISKSGKIKGRWKDAVFIPNDFYIPPAYNPQKQTMGQIKDRLHREYGIQFEGIPYVFGCADFSEVSLAHISTADMVSRITGMSSKEYGRMPPSGKAEMLERVFGDKKLRKRNSEIASEIAAERQFPIPGLPKDYSAEDLKKWIEGRCSWDEQISTGYHLVPMEIHGNIPHTGMVSVSHYAFPFLESRAQEIKKKPESYMWNEDEAPISYGTLKNNLKYQKYQRKRGRDMPRNRLKRDPLTIDKKLELEDLKTDAEEHIKEHKKLEELGEKYNKDMNQLASFLDRIKKLTRLSDNEKQPLLNKIEQVMERVEKLYNENVQEVEKEEQASIQKALDLIQAKADEFARQEDELKGATMNAADVKMSDIAKVSQAQKVEYERVKQAYQEKLDKRIEQSRRQQSEMRAKRLRS